MIEWARKNRDLFLPIAAGVIVAIGLSMLFITNTRPQLLGEKCAFRLRDNRCVALSVASSEYSRQAGLSGVNDLSNTRGMLFAFDNPDRACMWMKDMRFGLDIVWLNDSGQIIKIEKSISPETYPTAFCAPDNQPAKYVVEVNSGIADDAQLKVGQKIDI